MPAAPPLARAEPPPCADRDDRRCRIRRMARRCITIWANGTHAAREWRRVTPRPSALHALGRTCNRTPHQPGPSLLRFNARQGAAIPSAAASVAVHARCAVSDPLPGDNLAPPERVRRRWSRARSGTDVGDVPLTTMVCRGCSDRWLRAPLVAVLRGSMLRGNWWHTQPAAGRRCSLSLRVAR